MARPLIFLDVDGVLNPLGSAWLVAGLAVVHLDSMQRGAGCLELQL
jgi:hypothetical protein